MDPLACPICLDNFTEDAAYIPRLRCTCTLIVHLECWRRWSGECLYCRNTHLIENIEPRVRIFRVNNIYIINLPPFIRLGLFVLYLISLYMIFFRS